MTNNSSAARVKLSWRAAASKAFRAFSVGTGAACKAHEKNWGGSRNDALRVGPSVLYLAANSSFTQNWSRKNANEVPGLAERPRAGWHESLSIQPSDGCGLPSAQLYQGNEASARHRRAADQDDCLLADIGLTRDDVRHAVAQPIWRDPTVTLQQRAGARFARGKSSRARGAR